ncbi:diguanylate cyclase [Idiomarina loihiensis]|uniref:diguanylate cyclase n=1 Tax=Idiomarina loihiensis TaxID=135577 RepID=UPI00384D0EDF
MNDKTLSEKLDPEIQAIQNQYTERLVSDGSKLQSLVDQLSIGNAKQTADSLHRILHSISGSAGTFGFNEASTEARRIDEVLKTLISEQSETPLVQAIRREIPEFCQLLKQVSILDSGSATELAVDNSNTSTEKNKTIKHKHDGTVWLIEQDKQLEAQFSKQLTSFNFKIQTFELEQALKAAKAEGCPDALIIDLDGDDFNAITDIDTVLNAVSEPPRKLIMLSEDDGFDQRMKAAKARAISFLKKPVSLSELISHLEAILARQEFDPPRVMLIDDDKELCSFIKIELEAERMQVKVLDNIKNIIPELAEFRPELILLDMEMPDYSGIDIALLIRQHVQFESLPIVYLSAERDIDKQTEALLFDADDFLSKPISHKRLISSIRSRVHRARVLEQLISKDGLTGLLKHSAIKEHATRELERARRDGGMLSIVMLDIDHFKRVNDTYGHATGDTVIASLATLLRHRFRKIDIVGRYGGEEFMIILPNTNESDTFDVIDGIRNVFSEMEFTAQGETFYCTLSAGCICSEDFSSKASVSELIEAADKALYVSKDNGRNQVSKR